MLKSKIIFSLCSLLLITACQSVPLPGPASQGLFNRQSIPQRNLLPSNNQNPMLVAGANNTAQTVAIAKKALADMPKEGVFQHRLEIALNALRQIAAKGNYIGRMSLLILEPRYKANRIHQILELAETLLRYAAYDGVKLPSNGYKPICPVQIDVLTATTMLRESIWPIRRDTESMLIDNVINFDALNLLKLSLPESERIYLEQEMQKALQEMEQDAHFEHNAKGLATLDSAISKIQKSHASEACVPPMLPES